MKNIIKSLTLVGILTVVSVAVAPALPQYAQIVSLLLESSGTWTHTYDVPFVSQLSIS